MILKLLCTTFPSFHSRGKWEKSSLPGEEAGFYFSAFYGPDLRLWADGHTHLPDRAIILGERVHSLADCRLHRQPASSRLDPFHIGAVADWFQPHNQLHVWQLICFIQSVTSRVWGNVTWCRAHVHHIISNAPTTCWEKYVNFSQRELRMWKALFKFRVCGKQLGLVLAVASLPSGHEKTSKSSHSSCFFDRITAKAINKRHGATNWLAV